MSPVSSVIDDLSGFEIGEKGALFFAYGTMVITHQVDGVCNDVRQIGLLSIHSFSVKVFLRDSPGIPYV